MNSSPTSLVEVYCSALRCVDGGTDELSGDANGLLSSVMASSALMLIHMIQATTTITTNSSDDADQLASMQQVMACVPAAAAVASSAAPSTGAEQELAVELTNKNSNTSSKTESTSLASDTFSSLSPRMQALLLLAALWCATKFWVTSLARVSLSSLLMHMSESSVGAGEEEAADDYDNGSLRAPVGWGDDSYLEERMGGGSVDTVRSLEALEVVLLRCCAYTVPLLS